MHTPSPLPFLTHSDGPVLTPPANAPWVQAMVLNPAIVRDPDDAGRIHMLFRATGPCRDLYAPGAQDPYPIFLGYAFSDDDGYTWHADYARPALAPRLASEPDTIRIAGARGESAINYANGCIEDPRLTWLDGKLYLTVACRMFPPGPYWEHDDPLQCAPAWAAAAGEPFGRAARENLTVNVLYEVDLEKLATGQYDQAFAYLGPMTDPERGDNRDAFLFPERIAIGGTPMVVCVHRPREPWNYPGGRPEQSPSIYLAAAESLEDLPTDRTRHLPLAEGLLPWEGNRVGGSFSPLCVDLRQWLLPYHGKQNDKVGYTQSFMILEEDETGWPRVKHRCSDRLLFAKYDWQLSDRFTIPCIFTCGGVVTNSGELVMSYGAADEVVGVARTDFDALVRHIRSFDERGRRQEITDTTANGD